MRGFMWLGVVLLAIVLIAVTGRRGSGTPSATPPTVGSGQASGDEPITGTPAVSVPGDETPLHDPFSPPAIGPAPGDMSAKPFWSYADLTSPEQAVADRGRDTTSADATNAIYAAATWDIAQQAIAARAAMQLGTGNLASTGVVQ